MTKPTTKPTTPKVIRLEITISAPDGVDERDLLSRAIKVCSHQPADKAITIADAFETVGLTVTDVSRVEIGDRDPEFRQAADLAERWYLTEVRHCADGVIERLLEIDADDREDSLHEILHEEVDGRQCIIYTAQAQLIVAVSRNSDAYRDAFDEDATMTDEARAFFAMEQDVSENIHYRREEWHPDDMPEPEAHGPHGTDGEPEIGVRSDETDDE